MNTLIPEMREWLKSRYLYLRSFGPVRPLEAIEIETTTVCNRKCVYCPNSTIGRPPRQMEEATFYKIIDSLKKMNYQGRISPHFFGEPLMDDRIVPFIKYTRDNLPGAFIKFFTNGDLLTVDKYLELKRVGVDVFRISQHAQEQSQTIRETLAFIRKNHPEWYCIEYVNYYEHYYEKKNAENFLNNRGGTVEVKSRGQRYCSYVEQMTIDYAGNAVICINDYHSSVTFGNANDKDIADIWYNQEYVRARRKIIRGGWTYDLCRKCMGN